MSSHTTVSSIPAPTPFNRAARRATSPAHFEHVERSPVPPAQPLDLPVPDPPFLHDEFSHSRSRSGSRSDDERLSQSQDAWGDRERPSRPAKSTGAASNLTSRLTSLLATPRSPATRPYTPSHLSDAELEAEAQAERDHSRREAERILLMEAEQRRRQDEERAQLQSMLSPPIPIPSTPNRGRRSTVDGASPSTSPKPSVSSSMNSTSGEKSGKWWSIAKQKLTPTKDKEDSTPLTPAQEIIREARSREKAEREQEAREEKERAKASKNSWPASPKAKQTDPTYLALQSSSPTNIRRPLAGIPPEPLSPTPNRSPRPGSLSTPPPQASASRTNLNLTPSPNFGRTRANTPESTPLYAQFSAQTGTLDIPATLLTITSRFEKLEKWAVNHVRALEDRMKDVEKYLVNRQTHEDEVQRDINALRTSVRNLEAGLREAKSALATKPSQSPPVPSAPTPPLAPPAPSAPISIPSPSPYLSPSLVPPSPRSQISEHSNSTYFHSAAESPALDPYELDSRSSSPHQESEEEPEPTVPPSPRQGSLSSVTGPTGTVKSIFRNRLPYPSGDYYELASTSGPSVSGKSEHSTTAASSETARPATASRTESYPPSVSGSSLLSVESAENPQLRRGSQSPSAVLPMPRSVSPLDLGGLRSSASSVTSTLSSQERPPLPQSSSTSSIATTSSMSISTPNAKSSLAVSPSVSPRAQSKTPSPTPRKRYTVALSGKDEGGESEYDSTGTEGLEVHTAHFTTSPPVAPRSRHQSVASISSSSSPLLEDKENSESEEVDDQNETNEEYRGQPTIGRTPITLSRLSLSPPPTLSPTPRTKGSPSTRASPTPVLTAHLTTVTTPSRPLQPRTRAQSNFFQAGSLASALNSPSLSPYEHNDSPSPSPNLLRQRAQSQSAASASESGSVSSSAVSGLGIRTRDPDVFSAGSSSQTFGGSKMFVDPVLVRRNAREEMEKGKKKTVDLMSPRVGQKLPVGKLVGFFEKEMKERGT